MVTALIYFILDFLVYRPRCTHDYMCQSHRFNGRIITSKPSLWVLCVAVITATLYGFFYMDDN